MQQVEGKTRKNGIALSFSQLPPKVGNGSNWDCALTVLYLQIKSPPFPQTAQTPLSTIVDSSILKGNMQKGKAIKLVFTSGRLFFLSAVQMNQQTHNSVIRLPQGVLGQDITGNAACFPRIGKFCFLPEYTKPQHHKPQTASAATQSICK